eukprot:SAG31_NODE_25551_length_459_cov_0.955556_2_plen_59_part_00
MSTYGCSELVPAQLRSYFKILVDIYLLNLVVAYELTGSVQNLGPLRTHCHCALAAPFQ